MKQKTSTIAEKPKAAKDILLESPPIDNILYKVSVKKLDFLCVNQNIVQPDKAVLEAYQFKGYGRYRDIEPAQNPSELIRLARKVREKQPKTVVEIGTYRGGSLYVWTQALKSAEKFISINLPGDQRGGYTERRARFYENFTEEELCCILQNSHKEETKEILEKKLEGDKIDFLLIDGDHAYNGVKQDFEMYKNLVSDGGLIALHDILPQPDNPKVEVNRFWSEIKNEYKTEEIIADENQKRGFGLVKLDK